MMKMHGLGDGPYWMISYAYFLFISSAYMICFVVFGSVIGKKYLKCLLSYKLRFCIQTSLFIAGLKFFRLNDYSIQFVFYFIYINLQIAVAFLVATFFSDVKTASGLSPLNDSMVVKKKNL